MYSYADLLKILKNRFKAIPNVEEDDVETWLEVALSEHGQSKTSSLSPELATLILLHAEADGTGHVSLLTAHYFSFTDKDESVDKSMVSENYRLASEALWKRYREKKREGVEGFGGSRVSYMRRLDRDDVGG